MGLTIFETERARYYLALSIHVRHYATSSLCPHVKDLDALVFESGPTPHKEWTSLGDQPQFWELSDAINTVKPQLPLFAVDYPRTEASSHQSSNIDLLLTMSGLYLLYVGVGGLTQAETRDMQHSIATMAGIWLGSGQNPCLVESLSEKSYRWITTPQAIRTSLIPTARGGFRDAVNAKKLEDWLVQRYAPEGRKMNVGLVYGAAHAGLRPKLKHKWLRDATVRLYKTLNYWGAKKEDMNKVTEYRLKKGNLKIREQFDCGMF